MELTQAWKNKAQKSVQNGVSFLNSIRPRWRTTVKQKLKKFNTKLNMMSADCCILGLLYTDYYTAKEQLALPSREAVSRGFQLTKEEHDSLFFADLAKRYDYLTELWMKEINK